MSKSIQAMRERRDALAKDIRNVMDQNKATWAPEHQAKYDENMGEIERIDAEISREQRFMNLGAEKHAKDLGLAIVDALNPVKQKTEHQVIFNKYLRGGEQSLTAEDWSTIRNTMSTTTSSEGGYTVQSEVAAELIKAEKAFGGMVESSTVFATSKGNPMSWPTIDDTGNTGELIAENTTATDLDAAFGTVALNAYKFSSKVVSVPMELLQDSEVDIEAVVIDLLAERLARIKNTLYTLGTGTAQPRGIVTGAGSGKVGITGQTLIVTYDDLVDLEHSIDPAYRKGPGVGFMMNDASIKGIRKIKDIDGRPIFVPGYAQGVPGGAPATLMDRKIQINQDIAVMAANAKSILFGRLNNYRIRNVLQATMFRFTDSAFTKKGQVGFLAWSRAGGNLLDVGGATVKFYQNSAT